MTTVRDTPHGLRFLTDGHADVWLDFLFTDDRGGQWMLLSTEHDAVEVRVTPAGRKVTAMDTKLTHRAITGGDTDE